VSSGQTEGKYPHHQRSSRPFEKKKKKKTFSGGLDFTMGYYLGKIFSVIVST
jgi:hypothetical protein